MSATLRGNITGLASRLTVACVQTSGGNLQAGSEYRPPSGGLLSCTSRCLNRRGKGGWGGWGEDTMKRLRYLCTTRAALLLTALCNVPVNAGSIGYQLDEILVGGSSNAFTGEIV